MTEKTTSLNEHINPMRVTDNDKGVTYELDFSRDAVRFAENRGFEVDTVLKFPVTRIPELFYYAFRKNHKNVSKSQTDDLLERLGGLTGPMLERLIQLYNQAALTHVIAMDDEAPKNATVTVEL